MPAFGVALITYRSVRSRVHRYMTTEEVQSPRNSRVEQRQGHHDFDLCAECRKGRGSIRTPLSTRRLLSIRSPLSSSSQVSIGNLLGNQNMEEPHACGTRRTIGWSSD